MASLSLSSRESDVTVTRYGPVAGPGSVSYGGGAAVWRVKVPSQHLIVILLTNLQGSLPESFIGDIVALYARQAH